MSIIPAYLNPGDAIAIVAPSRKVSLPELQPFIGLMEANGFKVLYNDGLFNTDNQFAGTDKQRAADLQFWLDHSEVKAIVAARGGYGMGRIIDLLNFDSFVKKPKWLIGFSDFTVILSHIISNFNVVGLHGAMAAFLKPDSNTDVQHSYNALIPVLKGNLPQYELPENSFSIKGNCKGKLVGGNLSVLYSMMGSVSEIQTKDAILFLEDLDEYLYHIDRMMLCFKRAGKFEGIKGVVVGHMNDMHDNTVPFGKTVEQILLSYFQDLNIPVYFGFDAGHLQRNLPLILGMNVNIENNILTFDPS